MAEKFQHGHGLPKAVVHGWESSKCHYCGILCHWKAEYPSGIVCFASRRQGHVVRDFPFRVQVRHQREAQKEVKSKGGFVERHAEDVG